MEDSDVERARDTSHKELKQAAAWVPTPKCFLHVQFDIVDV